MGVIYLTTNNINGRQYIGVDTNNDKNYYGSGKIIRLALKKYSRTNFTKEILEENEDDKYLFEREHYWIDKYDAVNNENFYNIAEGGKGGAGTLNNEESKRLHRIGSLNAVKINNEKRKGKTYEEIYGDRADEEKEKRRIAGLGKKHSEERCENISKGLKNSDKIREKREKGGIPWNKGKKGLQIAWNKGITDTCLKIYTLTTPDNKILKFNGRKKLKEYIENENLDKRMKSRISIAKLYSEGKEKGYSLITTPFKNTK